MARNSRFLLLRRGLRVRYKKGGLPPLGSVIRAVMAHTHRYSGALIAEESALHSVDCACV